MSDPDHYVGPMTELSARNLTVLVGSAIVAFGLLYWALDVDLVAAITITAAYTVLALAVMYFKSKG